MHINASKTITVLVYWDYYYAANMIRLYMRQSRTLQHYRDDIRNTTGTIQHCSTVPPPPPLLASRSNAWYPLLHWRKGTRLDAYHIGIAYCCEQVLYERQGDDTCADVEVSAGHKKAPDRLMEEPSLRRDRPPNWNTHHQQGGHLLTAGSSGAKRSWDFMSIYRYTGSALFRDHHYVKYVIPLYKFYLCGDYDRGYMGVVSF